MQHRLKLLRKQSGYNHSFPSLFKNDEKPTATVIFGYNQGAIALAKNPQFHSRTKHITIQHHFLRKKLTKGKIDLQYIPMERQVADGLTKALPKDRFIIFCRAVGLDMEDDKNQ